MAFPDPPNFTSQPDPLGPFGAWWRYGYVPAQPLRSRTDVCETDGANVIAGVRRVLRLPPSPNRWDTSVASGLRQLVMNRARSAPQSGWGQFGAAIDPGSAQVSAAEMMAGIWAAFYAPNGLPIDGLELPSGARLPVRSEDFGASGGGIVCFEPGADPRPQDLADSQLNSARAASTSGVRLAPNESLSVPVRIAPIPSGLSGPTGAWLLVGLVAATGLVIWLVPKQPQRQSSP